MQPEIKTCQNCRNDFTIEPEDFLFYEKIKVPPPTWCPNCRFQRRCLFRNERKLFKNIDANTGKHIISLFPKESGFKVYDDKYWSGDEWDPFSYGMDFDRSRPFLAQLLELSKKVPRPRANVVNMVRSEYCANAVDLKNCYLLFNSNQSEDSAYGNGIDACKNCVDNSHISNSGRCYESFWLTKCYDTFFSSQCDECVSVWFSKNCRGCTNCFGCVNLVSKSYCFFNEQLSKEEYHKKISSLGLDSYQSLIKAKEKAEEFWLKFPVKYMQGVKNLDVSGEYITHSKNVKKSYLIREGEDITYSQYGQVPYIRDIFDSTVFGMNSELIYECSIGGWGSSRLRFCWECWDGGMEFEYSTHCGRKANYIFGCIGLNSGEYCVLNKHYKKDDYFKLVEEIKMHMNEFPYIDKQGRVYKYGEFLPIEFSPFAYNDTIANEHFPLSQKSALDYGSFWNDTPPNEYKITIQARDLPDSINSVNESVLQEVIACSNCNRAYRITEMEFQFLKGTGLPLPRICIDCRHFSRIQKRSKMFLYKRACMCDKENHHNHEAGKCKVEFETSYAPERPEIVYCEKCYQQEVY